MEYKVINNFLEENYFKELKHILFLSEFPWFWKDSTTPEKNDHFYFTHSFYNENKINSFYYEKFIINILNKLNCLKPIQVRANLTINKNKIYKTGFHIDYKNCKTAILYMNTCNSETILNKTKKIKIKSIENRLLLFNSNINHCAIIKKDVERRIIINFNFI
jgi:Pyruvate/2-oxoacid:ferredoxin oxidoreductase delta subunit